MIENCDLSVAMRDLEPNVAIRRENGCAKDTIGGLVREANGGICKVFDKRAEMSKKGEQLLYNYLLE